MYMKELRYDSKWYQHQTESLANVPKIDECDCHAILTHQSTTKKEFSIFLHTPCSFEFICRLFISSGILITGASISRLVFFILKVCAKGVHVICVLL